MNNEQSNYLCKFCYHLEESHGIFEETTGDWQYLDDIRQEVWREESYPRPVCYICNNDCIFEQMNNLEYLEWKYERNTL